MNEENTGHYLKSLHKELGDVIDIMINRIETNDIPENAFVWGYPVKVKNRFISLEVNMDNGEFYLCGKNHDGNY